jgi:hypothetical protein
MPDKFLEQHHRMHQSNRFHVVLWLLVCAVLLVAFLVVVWPHA